VAVLDLLPKLKNYLGYLKATKKMENSSFFLLQKTVATVIYA